MGNDFPTKCSKCGSPWTWDKNADPPEGSQRAKEGKPGWWSVDGKPHYTEQCQAAQAARAGPSPVDTQKPLIIDDVPNASVGSMMMEASNIYAQALHLAHENVKARYPDGHPAFSQIRSDVARNYVTIYMGLLKKQTMESIHSQNKG